MRINGTPGIRMQVTKQSGTNTIQIAEGVKREIEKINADVDGIKLQVLDDQSKFIDRAIGSVTEHAMLGGLLVVAIIFLFLRDIKSTLIICTSIPVSVIGTFALLYFGGYTLNTLTFGGLALGIGMIVDAAIVVLENTYRHLEMGKDRVTAAIDGSEEVWSAILASTLTHIAVFVPMLFLTGVSSIMFGQLAAVVSFSLAMSLLVAVTIVPVLCSRMLDAPHKAHAGAGLMADAQPHGRRRARLARRVLRPHAAPRAEPPPDRVRDRLRAVRGRDRSCCPGSASSSSRRPTKAKSRSTPSWRSARASRTPRRC